MKYRVTIGERDFVLDIDEANGGRRLAIGDEPIAADVAEVRADRAFNIILGGRSYTATVQRAGAGYAVAIAGRVYELGVEDERTRALQKLVPSHAEAGELAIRAPMPGLVLKVLVAPGQPVGKNAHLAILEAMKMENDISAPRPGTVKDVRVTAGQTVNKGDVLLVIA